MQLFYTSERSMSFWIIISYKCVPQASRSRGGINVTSYVYVLVCHYVDDFCFCIYGTIIDFIVIWHTKLELNQEPRYTVSRPHPLLHTRTVSLTVHVYKILNFKSTQTLFRTTCIQNIPFNKLFKIEYKKFILKTLVIF